MPSNDVDWSSGFFAKLTKPSILSKHFVDPYTEKHLLRVNNPRDEHSPIKLIDFISTSVKWQHFHDKDSLCTTILRSIHACTYILHLTTNGNPTNICGCPANRQPSYNLNALHLENHSMNLWYCISPWVTLLLPYSTRNTRSQCCGLFSVEKMRSYLFKAIFLGLRSTGTRRLQSSTSLQKLDGFLLRYNLPSCNLNSRRMHKWSSTCSWITWTWATNQFNFGQKNLKGHSKCTVKLVLSFERTLCLAWG